MTTYGFDPAAPSEMQSWLVERVAEYLPDLGEAVDPHRQLGEYGLDSIAVVAFAADVEEQLGIAVDPTAIWDYPTISELAQYLAGELTELRPQPA
ncbi:acyl carrier protein [Streptomyces sp. NPDC048564]|uniref:acyl carrier protein n=1 Tax=Streptomyces sp. NPDC048564 TaxID=3155760 RepID=UPI00344352B1